MTNTEFYALMDKTFNDARAIAKSKGEDYTRGSADALVNFKEAAKEAGIDPKLVWFVYARKHWVAVNNYIKTNGKSESEPIDARIKDLINYLVLLQGLITEEDSFAFPVQTGVPSEPMPVEEAQEIFKHLEETKEVEKDF